MIVYALIATTALAIAAFWWMASQYVDMRASRDQWRDRSSLWERRADEKDRQLDAKNAQIHKIQNFAKIM